jgi:hypothetical protein
VQSIDYENPLHYKLLTFMANMQHQRINAKFLRQKTLIQPHHETQQNWIQKNLDLFTAQQEQLRKIELQKQIEKIRLSLIFPTGEIKLTKTLYSPQEIIQQYKSSPLQKRYLWI